MVLKRLKLHQIKRILRWSDTTFFMNVKLHHLCKIV